MSKKNKQLKKTFRIWHRRLGIGSALVVLLLSLSGIFLNHSVTLGLDHRFIQSNLLLRLYGITPPELVAANAGAFWVLQAEHRLYIGKSESSLQPVACAGDLKGAVKLADKLAVLCAESLLIFDSQLALLDEVTPRYGLPAQLNKLGHCNSLVCLAGESDSYLFDIESGSWKANAEPNNAADTWAKLETPPARYAQAVTLAHVGNAISWERFVLDVHAGRFLGGLGPLLLDLFAILFILLSVTGVYMWMRAGKK